MSYPLDIGLLQAGEWKSLMTQKTCLKALFNARVTLCIKTKQGCSFLSAIGKQIKLNLVCKR